MTLEDVLTAYAAAWNATTAEECAEHLQRCMTPDARLLDPHASVAGYNEIIGFILTVRGQIGAAQVAGEGPVQRHPLEPWARYGWVIAAGDEVLMRGTDVVEVADDGRLRLVVTFLDDAPAA